MNFSGYDALRFNLNTSLGKNHSIETARDNHAIPFDLPFDFCLFSEDHRLLGDDVSLDVPVDAERSFNGQRSFKRHPLINEPGPLLARSVLRCCGPLPSHEILPE